MNTKITRAQFKEKLQFYTAGEELLFFLLNTINLNNGWQYCYCEKYGEKKA